MAVSHAKVNKDHWNKDAPAWVEMGEHAWAQKEERWGIWSVPEAELGLFPADMAGMTAVELGCGTGYVSAWMARRGAAVDGIDISAEQLKTARRLAAEHDLAVNFVEGDAEATGFADTAYDFAVSEYGAAIWCDPEVWLPEAWRILKPGGQLVFLGNHPLMMVCTPENGAPCNMALHRPYRDLRRIDWRNVEIDPSGIEFNRGTADWMRLFKDVGFAVLDYHELYAPADREGERFSVSAEWAKHFPSEQVWKLQKI